VHACRDAVLRRPGIALGFASWRGSDGDAPRQRHSPDQQPDPQGTTNSASRTRALPPPSSTSRDSATAGRP
jgi:hypothetical protein